MVVVEKPSVQKKCRPAATYVICIGVAKGSTGFTGTMVATRVKTGGQKQCPWRLVG